MTPRQTAAVEAALGRFADYTAPKPRLEALYVDARMQWLNSRSAAHDLHDLLVVMAFERKEVEPADDEQIRLAYGIRRKA